MLETYIVGDDTTLVYVTYWTILHFISGVLVAYFGASYTTGFWIHTAWELFQIAVRNTPVHTLRGRVDIVTDSVFFMLGMAAFKTKR
jgi:hypothetical protein